MKNHTGEGSYPNGLRYTADNGLVNTRISMGKAKFSTYQVDAGTNCTSTERVHNEREINNGFERKRVPVTFGS